ncbi:hypothetical protein Tco_0893226 [Tanacetum coccineum]|uniref:Uncharacterized protein n=1 Tax=Tanacetum coccineum TaxID=301880 RepID=A0ABQ5CEE3_9ASTR
MIKVVLFLDFKYNDVNVNAPAEQAPAMALPARTDDQILPRIRWVPIGKSTTIRSESHKISQVSAKEPTGKLFENEPGIGDEEANLQKAVKKGLKEFHSARQGLLPPVVIMEPESRKFQPLLEVQGKDQFIFQRRTSTPTESSGHDESSSLYAELVLTDSESESDEEVPGIVTSVQDEGQARPNPDLEHMDLEASDTSIQPNPEQMDEEFTTTAYPNVQENLKLPTEGEVRLEEPVSSLGTTLSSLQNLDKELSFTNQFLTEKSQEDEPKKTNIKTEVQSMVTVPIHQDTSSVPLMTTPVIETQSLNQSPQRFKHYY